MSDRETTSSNKQINSLSTFISSSMAKIKKEMTELRDYRYRLFNKIVNCQDRLKAIE